MSNQKFTLENDECLLLMEKAYEITKNHGNLLVSSKSNDYRISDLVSDIIKFMSAKKIVDEKSGTFLKQGTALISYTYIKSKILNAVNDTRSSFLIDNDTTSNTTKVDKDIDLNNTDESRFISLRDN